MSKRSLFSLRLVALLTVTFALLLRPAPTSAEPKLGKRDPLIAQLVCEFLKHGHLSRPDIDGEISKRLFNRFLKDVDPNKLYLLKSDIDEFKKQESKLSDQLVEGDLAFPYLVYDRLLKRMNEDQELIKELVGAKQDYTVKESLTTDPDVVAYAADADAVRERWRKRIKFDLLMQKLAEKPLSEDEAKKKVLDRYQGQLKRWKQLDNTDLLEVYLTDLASCLDPHSTYMSPSTLDDFEIAIRLNLDGIGAVLRSENGQATIAEVVPGGAAAKDGRLKPKDRIIAVAQGDDKFVDIVDMKLQEAVKLIRGKRDTKVQLKVVPVGKIEPVVYELTRQKVELKSQEARGEIVEQGKKPDGKPYLIGVIDLPGFYADPGATKDDVKSAAEDVRKILKDFEAKHVDGVVLDLRANGGGLLTEALAVTGLFIDQGPIVQVKGATGRVERKDDPDKGIVYGGPLMVLVSRFSASASEILAGALQDYGRALIVGDTSTYGKGTVQTVVDLGGLLRADPPPKLGALKLTIQGFYRPNGDSTQSRGVASDVVLPTLTEVLTGGEKESDYAMPFDKVKPVEHEEMGLVPPELKKALQEKSTKRVKDSKDFARLAKDIELLKERKDRKSVPLNEKDLKALLARDDDEKIDKKVEESTPSEKAGDGAPYKFRRNFLNNELLNIMEDYIQGVKR
jgi:carboxyl-terminal processing protease